MKKLLLLNLLVIFFIGKATTQTVVTLQLADPCSTTDIIEYPPLEKSFDFSVYPNPAEDRVIIDVESVDKVGHIRIQFVNLQGAVVMRENIFSENNSCIKPIDISALPRGLYIITIYKGAESQNKKIIIQ